MINKKLMLLPLIALLLAGCGGNVSSSTGQEVDDWGISKDETGGKLLLHLHQISLEKHKTYVTYASFQSYVTASAGNDTSIDQAGSDANKVELFYTGKKIAKTNTSSWSREHVWACANSSNLWVHESTAGVHYVDGSNYKGGGSDLYHVRPATKSINTQRLNSKLYEFGASEAYYKSQDGGPYANKLDNLSSATKVEPDDAYKGDMARIVCYVYMHYSKLSGDEKYDGTDIANYLGSLSLRNIFHSGYNFQTIYQILVKWNNLDPVSETEKIRNDTVEKIQGNRNPFVDHPEYMARMFDIEA